ncbi:SH3 domain-containing protein [Leptolyngbya sp. AN03gr2]|uniref:SH3 domain-containing protein n=1 Tax=unclassified Leptolyngbya TaxID=2650499 RepID=UPI003D314AF3
MLLDSFWLRLSGSAALLALIAGCSSQVPTVSTSPAPVVATSPTVSTSPSPVAAPQATQKEVRTVEKCVIRMAKVNDPESPLNIRSTPDATSKDNIVGQLKNGSFVDVQDQQNGWLKIGGATPGWIAQSRTEHGCNEKVERIELGQTSIEIRDRFIGTGSHSYRFNLTKGQRITVKSSSDRGSIFPTIVAPSGKPIVEPPDQPSSWTGELTETGEYTFEYESNFKGYEYTLSVDPR